VGGTNTPPTHTPGQLPPAQSQPGDQHHPTDPGTGQQHIPGPGDPTGTTTQGSGWTPPGTGGTGFPNYPGGYPGSGGQGGPNGQGGGGFMPPMGTPGFGGGGGSGYGSGGGFGAGGMRGATSGAASRPGAGAAAGLGAEEEGAMRGGAMAGRPGAAGAAGAGGMGAGGRGGKKEEDKEHKSAAYLVNDDNANDIVGDLPPTVPPVIGG
jgi:hypothetical protein